MGTEVPPLAAFTRTEEYGVRIPTLDGTEPYVDWRGDRAKAERSLFFLRTRRLELDAYLVVRECWTYVSEWRAAGE